MMRLSMDEARMLERRAAPGDLKRAAQLLEEAHGIATGLGMETAVAQIENQRASLDSPEPAEETTIAEPAAATAATLRREGDVWAFHYDGHDVRIRDSKGMRCLALLLASPGVEMHALSGEPDRAEDDLVALGEKLGSSLS